MMTQARSNAIDTLLGIEPPEWTPPAHRFNIWDLERALGDTAKLPAVAAVFNRIRRAQERTTVAIWRRGLSAEIDRAQDLILRFS